MVGTISNATILKELKLHHWLKQETHKWIKINKGCKVGYEKSHRSGQKGLEREKKETR